MDLLEDNKLFRRLGFFKTINLNLKTDANQFIAWFAENVGSETNFFGGSAHDRYFHGKIKTETREIYKSTSMADDTNVARGRGTYLETGSELQVSLAIFIPMTVFAWYFSMASISVVIVIILAITQANFSGHLAIFFELSTVFFYFWIAFHLQK